MYIRMHIYIYDIKEFCIYPKSSYPHAPNSPQLATVLILRHCFWGMNFGLQLFLWFRVARPVKMFHYTPLGYMEKILSHCRVQITAYRKTHMTGFKPGVTKVTDQPPATCMPGLLYIQLIQLGENIWLLSTEEAGTSKLSWIALNMTEHINHSFLFVIHIMPNPPTVIFITHRGPRNLDLALDIFMFGGHMGSISS